jgi:hypothetical protein
MCSVHHFTAEDPPVFVAGNDQRIAKVAEAGLHLGAWVARVILFRHDDPQCGLVGKRFAGRGGNEVQFAFFSVSDELSGHSQLGKFSGRLCLRGARTDQGNVERNIEGDLKGIFSFTGEGRFPLNSPALYFHAAANFATWPANGGAGGVGEEFRALILFKRQLEVRRAQVKIAAAPFVFAQDLRQASRINHAICQQHHGSRRAIRTIFIGHGMGQLVSLAPNLNRSLDRFGWLGSGEDWREQKGDDNQGQAVHGEIQNWLREELIRQGAKSVRM